MTTFFLIRHADTNALGHYLAGRMPVSLNHNGKAQAQRLGKLLSQVHLKAIYTSPLQRTLETADAIAKPHQMKPTAMESLTEMSFGEWEGKQFSELYEMAEWQEFNRTRSTARPPGGELAIEVQSRVIRAMADLRAAHPQGHIAVVSHGDPLRSIIAHCLGIPLDLLQRFHIDPASISIVRFDGGNPDVLGVNYTGALPLPAAEAAAA